MAPRNGDRKVLLFPLIEYGSGSAKRLARNQGAKMIGILPTLLDANKQSPKPMLVGSEAASRDFTKNMMRWLQPGSIGYLLPDVEVSRAVTDLSRLYANEGGNYLRQEIWPLSKIPEIIRRDGVTAIHDSTGASLHHGAHLRSQFGCKPFPVTCLVYGFSYFHAYWDLFTRLLLTPTLPCDSVICPTETARQAFDAVLQHVRHALCEIGCAPPRPNPRLDVIPLGVDIETYCPRNRTNARPMYADVYAYLSRASGFCSDARQRKFDLVVYRDPSGRWRLALSEFLYVTPKVCLCVDGDHAPVWDDLARRCGIYGTVFPAGGTRYADGSTEPKISLTKD